MKLLHSIIFFTSLEIFQQVQKYKSLQMFVQTLENTENEKSFCTLRRLLIRLNQVTTISRFYMNTRLTHENRLLYNELVESKPINAISNGGVREKVEELYK